MADTTDSMAPRRTRVPQWLYEGVDLVQQRRRALLITFGLVVVIAGAVAIAAPDVLPPTLLVGAAVGVAALLLALAVLIALDTASIKVRGPRHIRAAGGELVAVLPAEPSATGADDLARAIQDARPPGRTLLLGIAAATGDGKRVGGWTQVVARSLAEQDLSVLSLDLTADGGDRPGFLEVVRHGHKLAEVVELDPEVRLATLGPGRDSTEALRAFNEAGRWIPRDLDVLLVALPMAASRAVVRASLSLDQMLIVAERDRTSRVELIAGLDATEAVGTHSQVILIDDTYARYLGIGEVEARSEPEPPQDGDEVEADPELEELLGHASTSVAAEAGPAEGAAFQPEPEARLEPEFADEPEVTSEPELDAGPDVAAEAAPEVAAEPEPEVATQAEAEPEPEVATQAEAEPEPEVATQPEVAAEPDPEAEAEPEGGPEPEADVAEATESGPPAEVEDGDEPAELGVRDVQMVMDAAAATALADISANSQAEVPEEPSGGTDVPEPAVSEPDVSEPDVTEPGRSDAASGELTVRVHRPEPIDEEESTLEVERPAEVDDALAANRPDPIDVGTPGTSQEIDLNEIEAEDHEDLLNATARLSLLMDEVSDRGADDGSGRP